VTVDVAPGASTINAIVFVGAAPEPAALVNAVMTVTEAKASTPGALVAGASRLALARGVRRWLAEHGP
jgi:adenosylcobinamide amidohydrolase